MHRRERSRLVDDSEQDHERGAQERRKRAVDLLGHDERVDREEDQGQRRSRGSSARRSIERSPADSRASVRPMTPDSALEVADRAGRRARSHFARDQSPIEADVRNPKTESEYVGAVSGNSFEIWERQQRAVHAWGGSSPAAAAAGSSCAWSYRAGPERSSLCSSLST